MEMTDIISQQRKAFFTKDRLIRGVTEDGFLKVAVVKTTDVVKEANRRHGLSLLSTVMLGRALTGVMLLASHLKGEERVVLRVEGRGPLGNISVEANHVGEIRGYVSNPQATISIEMGEKLEDGVGRGLLSVSKILLSEGQPVTGTVAIQKGNISGDIADYLYYSEQIPSAILLDVGITPEGDVEEAGGILVQALPGAPVEYIQQVEQNLQELRSISHLLREGDYIDTLLAKALNPLPFKELLRYPVHFFCRCSKERFARALLMLPLDDLQDMQEESQNLECHYCNEHYKFTAQEIQELVAFRLRKNQWQS